LTVVSDGSVVLAGVNAGDGFFIRYIVGSGWGAEKKFATSLANQPNGIAMISSGTILEFAWIDASNNIFYQSQQAVPLNPTVSVSCNPNVNVIQGKSTTCTATVTGSGATPTGTVSWSADNGGTFTPSSATCTLDGTGKCSITFEGNSASPTTLTASYSGDGLYNPTTGTIVLNIGRTPSLFAASLLAGAFALFALDSLWTAFKYGYVPEKKFKAWMSFAITATIVIIILVFGGL
jgi:hypothetical protein